MKIKSLDDLRKKAKEVGKKPEVSKKPAKAVKKPKNPTGY